jgi:hydroxymethylpyrimidine pyrophosphatase-like HAD family hydrolase
VTKGIIALDIDGTITAHAEHLPQSVSRYLTELAQAGWTLLFVTGRPFKWGFRTLKELPFPYYFAVQNGAIVLQMPSQRVISKRYLSPSIFAALDSICQPEANDYAIYAGYEQQDLSYYRPKNMRTSLLHYLQERMKFLQEEWIALDSYDALPVRAFPSIKCIGGYEEMGRLKSRIEKELQLHVPLIRDPVDAAYYVLQGTAPGIDKGEVLKQLIALNQCQGGNRGPVIAAGDDQNDLALFLAADFKIAMATAPKELLERADIIAPPASEEGIIPGLQAALRTLEARA